MLLFISLLFVFETEPYSFYHGQIYHVWQCTKILKGFDYKVFISIKNISRLFLSLIIAESIHLNSFAVDDVDTSENIKKLEDMSLDDLFKVPVKPEVTVASKSEMTLNKSPGIITLISDKDIANSGARDLLEVLQLVPGFTFHEDVQGAISLGIRGLWAEEGKALVIIDGQEMNDPLWSVVLFGNHFPVEQIKRIEVLRGAGSSIYGGQAELAVINIITKSAEDLNGFSSKLTFGLIPTNLPDFTHRNFSLSLGKKFNDFKIVAHGMLGKGNRSNRIFTDFYGSKVDLTGNQELNPMFLNLGLDYKDLSARFIMDLYRRTSRDIYSKISPDSIGAIQAIHDGYYAEIKYNYKPFENLIITPKLNYKLQYPWNSYDDNAQKLDKLDDYAGSLENSLVERYSANLTGNWDLNENINFIGGGEFYYDTAKALISENAIFGKDGKQSSISYNNISAFAQGLYKTDYLSFTLGSRYENHSAYGSSFVPRAAATAIFGDFHAKLLYSKAFRAPSIENISLFYSLNTKNTSIKPENTTVIELETGYEFTKKFSAKANLFDITINDPIIYYSNDQHADAYDNFNRTGTRGVEIELDFKDKKWGYGNLSYSLNLVNDNKVDVYDVPGHPGFLLGFPMHKFTFNSSLNLTDNFSVNPSAILFGTRYGYTSFDKNNNPVIQEFAPTLLINLNLMYKNLFTEGLTASFGVYNLLNQTYYFIQPYNGLHAPLPGPETELSFNLGYDFQIRGDK